MNNNSNGVFLDATWPHLIKGYPVNGSGYWGHEAPITFKISGAMLLDLDLECKNR